MSRLSQNQLATMFAGYRKARRTIQAPNSVTTQVREELEMAEVQAPCRKSIRRWVKTWDDNGGNFVDTENRSYTKEPRKLSPRVKKRVKKRLQKLGSVKAAANSKFKNEAGEVVMLCRTTVAKVRDEYFDVREPKNNKIILTPHHKKMRLKFALREVAKFEKRKVTFSH